jgi:excisionase family DNA binding protein
VTGREEAIPKGSSPSKGNWPGNSLSGIRRTPFAATTAKTGQPWSPAEIKTRIQQKAKAPMPSHESAPAETRTNSALLTKEEVAKLLRVSTRTIERFVRTGRLPALKLSSKITRFQRANVEAFMASTGSLFLCPEGEVLQ